MAILGTCPTCGARAPLDTYLLDSEARRALGVLCERLAAHPEVIRRVPAYLALHGKPGRSASWPKVARLIGELANLVAAPAVSRGGSARPCTPELWALAMDAAQDARAAGTLSVPLDGHGWLAQVAFTKAGQAESRAEAQRLAAQRGDTPTGYHPSHAGAQRPGQPAGELSDLVGELAALRRLDGANPGAHAEQIGRVQARLAELRAAANPQPINPPTTEPQP